MMQSIILFGSMLYAVNTLIEGTFAGAAVLPLTFIGGFIFHLFWEGKCQYTLPYFMLLLPLSIIGFTAWQRNCPQSQRSIYTNVVYLL